MHAFNETYLGLHFFFLQNVSSVLAICQQIRAKYYEWH